MGYLVPPGAIYPPWGPRCQEIEFDHSRPLTESWLGSRVSIGFARCEYDSHY